MAVRVMALVGKAAAEFGSTFERGPVRFWR